MFQATDFLAFSFCSDSQPPIFGESCPRSPLVAYAERGKFTALVNWTDPVVIDNSGVAPTVTSNYQSPQRFSQGSHVITYRAVDQSGNEATCSFQVRVTGTKADLHGFDWFTTILKVEAVRVAENKHRHKF